jgi:pyridoxamine 5'-phosphate oxidase family protein
MSPFTEKEIEYLRGQRLGRLATVGREGSPHVVPVGFRLDAGAVAIEVGGYALSRSKKWTAPTSPTYRWRRSRTCPQPWCA